MKILHIANSTRGGAGRAAVNLHTALLKSGADSKMLVLDNSLDIPFCFSFERHPLFEKILWKFSSKLNFSFFQPDLRFKLILKKHHGSYGIATYYKTRYDVTKHHLYHEADIINLHWIAEFVDYPTFFTKNIKPVVWTLHDMNPFRGIFHYDNDEKINSASLGWLDDNIRRLKTRLLKKVNNLTIVCLSTWLMGIVKESQAFRHCPTNLIYNSVNTDLFRPFPQKESRDIFNLPNDKKILLFVSDNISNPRKGIDLLLDSFEHLKAEIPDFLCVVAGKNKDISQKAPHFISIGEITDDRLMALLYNCADIFILSSIQDNLPNTMLESLSCGVPVVGFPVGGLLDVIQPGVNGIVANEITAKSLAEAISIGLKQSSFDKQRIRNMAISEFDKSVQSNNYMNIYNDLSNQQNRY